MCVCVCVCVCLCVYAHTYEQVLMYVSTCKHNHMFGHSERSPVKSQGPNNLHGELNLCILSFLLVGCRVKQGKLVHWGNSRQGLYFCYG